MNPNNDPISPLLALASRNAMIINWFDKQTEETKYEIRMLYAGHLGCPFCEITERLLEPEDLDFIWSLFSTQIKADDDKKWKK